MPGPDWAVDDPYFIAFTRALLELAHYAQGDDRISLICDDDAETAWDCYRHYRGVRRVHDLAREKIVSLSFADDKHFPALQAADLVSFLARLEAKSQFYQIPYSFNVLLRYLIPEVQNQKMIWKVMLKNKREMIDLSDALEGKKRRP